MALQMVVETLEGMDEGIAKLYAEKDGKFRLDVDGHKKNDDPNRIPKSRLDQEIEKRKMSETALNEIANTLTEDIPEDMRDIVPDLPPAQKIKWIKTPPRKVFSIPLRPIAALTARGQGSNRPKTLTE